MLSHMAFCTVFLFKCIGPLFLILTINISVEANLANKDFSGSLALEGRWYPEPGLQTDQRSHAGGFTAAPKLYFEDKKGQSFTFLRFSAMT